VAVGLPHQRAGDKSRLILAVAPGLPDLVWVESVGIHPAADPYADERSGLFEELRLAPDRDLMNAKSVGENLLRRQETIRYGCKVSAQRAPSVRDGCAAASTTASVSKCVAVTGSFLTRAR